MSSADELEPSTSLKQTKITTFVNQPKQETSSPPPEKKVVDYDQYQYQLNKVKVMESDLLRAKNAQRVIKLENLPDKGKSLLQTEKALNNLLQQQKNILDNMIEPPPPTQNKIQVAWDEIEAGVGAVAPRTFGKKGKKLFLVVVQVI